MTRKPILITLCGLALLVADPCLRAEVINFDGIADGAIIDSYFAGLTFSNPVGGSVYARSTTSAESAQNVVSVFATGYPAYFGYYGAVEVTFTAPQTSVSIDAAPVRAPEGYGAAVNRPYLQAFDLSNNLLGTVYYAGVLPDVGGIKPYETLSFSSATTNIAKVRFTVSQTDSVHVWGLFDNLTYTTDTPSGDVPDPSLPSALFPAIAIGLGILERRLRRRSA